MPITPFTTTCGNGLVAKLPSLCAPPYVIVTMQDLWDGVPVLITNQAYPQPSTTELAFLSWDGDAVNALQADWIIADSNGTANVVVTKISDSTFTASGIENGAVPEFETKCPNCVVDVVDINFGQVELTFTDRFVRGGSVLA